MIRKVAPACLNVVGGHQPTIMPNEFNDPAVDLIVRGEGVESFAEICATRAAGGTQFEQIRGLTIRTPEGLKATEDRPQPPDINRQPLPDRSLTAQYRRDYFTSPSRRPRECALRMAVHIAAAFVPAGSIRAAIGALRDPERIFEDICSIKEPFIYFYDENSFHDVARMTKLAHLLIDAGVKSDIMPTRGPTASSSTPSFSSCGRGPGCRWYSSAWNRSTPARSRIGTRKSRPRLTSRPST